MEYLSGNWRVRAYKVSEVQKRSPSELAQDTVSAEEDDSNPKPRLEIPAISAMESYK